MSTIDVPAAQTAFFAETNNSASIENVHSVVKNRTSEDKMMS